MSIARNTRMFLAIAIDIPVQHVRMLINPMSLVLRDVLLFTGSVAAGRSPGQIIPTDFNIVVGKFAQLVVVHAEQFGFFRGPQVETRDEVDDVGDDVGHDKGPAGGGADVGDLHVERPPLVIDPSAFDYAGVDAVETDDVRSAEEGIR